MIYHLEINKYLACDLFFITTHPPFPFSFPEIAVYSNCGRTGNQIPGPIFPNIPPREIPRSLISQS